MLATVSQVTADKRYAVTEDDSDISIQYRTIKKMISRLISL